MGFREWILPQDHVFFNWLDNVAENASDAAKALQELLDNFGELKGRRDALKDLEHKGDQLSHDVFDALGRSFITPIDREDIVQLTRSFDSVVDFAYAAANRLLLFEIKEATPEMKEFARILVQQTAELQEAMRLVRNPKKRAAATKHTIEVNRLENDADELLNRSVASLFSSADAIRIIKYKEVYEMLENATDRCEDVADALSDVIRKHQ